MSIARFMQMAAAGVETSPWKANPISEATYDSKSFSVQNQSNSPWSVSFNPDGDAMYISDQSFSAEVFQYSLSTSGDVSTASYASKKFSFASQDDTIRSHFIADSGTKMYGIGTGQNTVYQYSLSTAYDVSSASYSSKSFDVSSEATLMYEVHLGSEGAKMYVLSGIADRVYQYSLSTEYDVSTASYDSVNLNLGTEEATPRGISFSIDGTKLYAIGNSNDTVFQYTMTTAWDLSTASYDNESFSVSSQDNSPNALTFNQDGTKMYVVGDTANSVFQYTTG